MKIQTRIKTVLNSETKEILKDAKKSIYIIINNNNKERKKERREWSKRQCERKSHVTCLRSPMQCKDNKFLHGLCQ